MGKGTGTGTMASESRHRGQAVGGGTTWTDLDPAPRGASRLAAPGVLVLAATVFALTGVTGRDYWRPDEPYVAGIAAEMARGGSLAVPSLNGRPFLEKPPLGYWGVAAAFRALGPSPAAARLPSVAYGLLAAALLGVLACRVYGTRAAGVSAAVLLLLTQGHYWTTHRCLVDPALGAAVVGAVLALHGAVADPARRGRWTLAAAPALAAAFLAKGALGLAFPAFAVLGLLLARNDLGLLRTAWPWKLAALVGVFVLPWVVALVAEAGWEGLRVFVVDNHLRRFFPEPDTYHGGHAEPPLFYVDKVLVALLPGLVLLPAGLGWHRERRARPEVRDALGLAGGWFVLGLVLLSLAGTKRVIYLLPILPAPVLLVGGWLGDLLGEPRSARSPLERWTLVLAAALPVAAVVVPLAAYAWVAGQPPDAGLAALGAVAAAAGALAVHAARAWRPGRALLLAGASLPLAGAAALGVWLPWLDARESLSSFYAAARTHVPPGARLVAGFASEATQGFVTLHLERRVELEYDDARLRATLAGPDLVYAIVEERCEEDDDPASLGALARAVAPEGTVVLARHVAARRCMTLLRN